MLVYGLDGLGKTSLIKSLECKPEEILLVAADPGQLALAPISDEVRKKKGLPDWLGKDMRGVKYIAPKTGEEFAAIREWIKREAHKQFKWVFIDGLDEVGNDALRLFKDKEKAKGSKANLMKAYGDMADAMELWIGEILDSNVSSVFITHVDESDEKDVMYGPAFPGKKMTAALGAMFDEVLCLRWAKETPTSPTKRWLQCTPDFDPRFKIKDRSGMLNELEEPNLQTVLNKVFGYFNQK